MTHQKTQDVNFHPPIVKSFNTVLTDNPLVRASQATLQTISYENMQITIPDQFDGRVAWQNYLIPIRAQGTCGSCWANASTSSLSDRFTILTYNQVAVDLSALALIICSGVLDKGFTTDPTINSQANFQAHNSASCYGNTLFNAAQFLYQFGTPDLECNSLIFISDPVNVLNFTDVSKLPTCDQIMGKAYDTCNDNVTAARIYRIAAAYNVASDEKSIMAEIYRYGPVAAGFIVFDNFLNTYDGKSIYRGPEAKDTPQGGHAIVVLGWGTDKVDGKDVSYWVCANSWTAAWGDQGYFKIERNLASCQLEKNVMALFPDLPGTKLPPHLQTSGSVNLGDRKFEIDPYTGYPVTALSKIKQGKLKGDLLPLVIPDFLPDMSTFVAAQVSSSIRPPSAAQVLHYVETLGSKYGSKYSLTKPKTNGWVVFVIVVETLLLVLLGSFLGWLFWKKKIR